MLKAIMALLWKPPKEVINHQEKKKKQALHSVYKKKLPANSELLVSGKMQTPILSHLAEAIHN